MSEFDGLKINIKKFAGLSKGMVEAGNLSMTYNITTEELEKDSLDIIEGLEKEMTALKELSSKKRKTKKR